MTKKGNTNMTKKMKLILAQLEDSCISGGLAVHDHLKTVAENWPEYAADESMIGEAEALIAHARFVIDELRRPDAPGLDNPALDIAERGFTPEQ